MIRHAHPGRIASRRSALAALGLTMGAWLAAMSAAQAHPHVWVSVKSELVFDGQGRIGAIRHAWTFDAAYSAFATQGLDKNGDGKLDEAELADLAKVNVESLNEYNYFTGLKTDGAARDLGEPTGPRLVFENGTLTLSFTLPLKQPAAPGKAAVLEVYDPTYFVSFAMAEGADAATLSGTAPKGCALTVNRPKPPDTLTQQRLSESFFEALSPGANVGLQFANRVLVACP